MLRLSTLFFFLLLAACAKDEDAQNGPLLIKIDPRDRARFDLIRNEPSLTEKQREQILFLQQRGHDISWFPNTIGEIVTHETMQVIFFNYETYTLGFCSGMMVSGNFVLTSGHCVRNTPTLQADRALCDGKVLFATKATKTGPLEYYRCDRIVSYNDSRNGYDAGGMGVRYVLGDHLLFRMNNRGGSPPVNRFVRDAVGRSDYVAPGAFTLGLVVDPPVARAPSLRSKYEVVVSQVVNGHDLAARLTDYPKGDALHMEAARRGFIGGNSGSPVYLLDAPPPVGGVGVFTGNRVYLGPLSSVAIVDPKFSMVPLLTTFLPSVTLWVRP